jgi:hypothetical protein
LPGTRDKGNVNNKYIEPGYRPRYFGTSTFLYVSGGTDGGLGNAINKYIVSGSKPAHLVTSTFPYGNSSARTEFGTVNDTDNSARYFPDTEKKSGNDHGAEHLIAT